MYDKLDEFRWSLIRTSVVTWIRWIKWLKQVKEKLKLCLYGVKNTFLKKCHTRRLKTNHYKAAKMFQWGIGSMGRYNVISFRYKRIEKIQDY